MKVFQPLQNKTRGKVQFIVCKKDIFQEKYLRAVKASDIKKKE